MSRRNAAAVLDSPASPAAPAPGEVVRYTTAEGAEVDARVVEADGDRLDLAYRSPDGGAAIVEGVAHGPNLVLHWFRPGERPAHPKGPEAAGRPILVGSPIVLHAAQTDVASMEHFEVIAAVVTRILDDGAFLADPVDGAARRLRVNAYSPEKFRKGGWNWPEDNVTAPPPRREVLPIDRPVTCPITGRSLPRKAGIPVSVGGASAPDIFTNDGMLSPEGAAALRAFLRGEADVLRAKGAAPVD